MNCGDFFHCLPKRSNNADNLEFTLVVLRMVIAYYLGYPLEEFVEGIIAAVRTCRSKTIVSNHNHNQ